MTTYSKLSLAEVEQRFAHCRAEPSMRSVTAILRITREQVGARGFLWQYPKATVAASILALVLLGLAGVLSADIRSKLLPPAIGMALVAAMLAYGTISGARDRREAMEQERELRRSAAESLEEILASPFPRKRLEREHFDTLGDLVKANPGLGGIRRLLVEARGE